MLRIELNKGVELLEIQGGFGSFALSGGPDRAVQLKGQHLLLFEVFEFAIKLVPLLLGRELLPQLVPAHDHEILVQLDC